MANVIKPKRSNTAAKVPNTTELTSGELGVNMADRKVYINNGTAVVQVGAGNLSGLGDVVITSPTNNQTLVYNSTTSQWNNAAAGAGTGTVTSVATGSGLTGGPITASGTISLATAYGDTVNPYASKTANNFLAAPNGAAGNPTFRAIVSADIPVLNQNTTGSSGSCTGNAATATNVAYSGLTGTVPTWNQNTTGTAENVTGTVAVSNGGTGQTAYTDGQLLIGNTTGGTLAKATLSAGTGVSVANGAGSITITNTAPDQTVALTGAGATSITGTYPNFTITSVNTTYSLATSTVLGLIELGSDTQQTVATNAVTATASRSYALQVNAAAQGVVNVPWTDTVYTLPAATTTVLGGIELGSDTQQTVAANAVSATASRSYALQVNAAGQGVVNVPWTDTNSGGTVTSVGGTGTVSGLSLSGTVTTSGNLTLGGTLSVTPSNFASQTANTVLAAPNGAAGVPTFRTLVAADIPALPYGTGTVTSVATAGTISGLTLTGGTITTTGTITLGGTLAVTPSNFASQTANTFLAAPNGAAGVPTFRAMVAADVPMLNQNTTGTAANVTGTVAVANGGTGSTTAATARTNLGATTLGGNLFTLANVAAISFPRFNADNTISALDAATFRTAIGAGTSSTTGTVTSVGGTGTVNGITLTGSVTSSGNLTLGGTLSGVSLTSQVLGTLPIANGGTGATTATAALTSLGAYPASNPNGYITNGAATAFPAGTVMMFAQTSAPTGWTKLTTHDNKALRVVSGTAGSGGSVAFTTAFASQAVSGSVSSTTATNQNTTAAGTVGNTTLSVGQIPAHSHASTYLTSPSAGGGIVNSSGTAGTATFVQDTGGSGSHAHSFTGTAHTHTQDSHSHTFTGTAINLAVQYVDVILASKN